MKLTYLKSLLSGEAARSISSMIISDANYDIAWDQLKNRYHNKRELLFSILKRFTNQSNINGTSATTIRTLVDVCKETQRSLEVLAITTDTGMDAFMMFIMFQKLDQFSKELWEQSLKDSEIPKLKDLTDFLEQRSRALAAGGHKSTGRGEPDHNRRVAAHHAKSTSCIVCSNSDHIIYKCSKFIEMQVRERIEFIRNKSLCFNCLHTGHQSQKCPNNGRCRSCGERHNSLLHVNKEQRGNKEDSQQVQSHHARAQLPRTILATAKINVLDRHGNPLLCRAFLDPGSTNSFITSSLVKRLGLSRDSTSATVTGLASATVGQARGSTTICINANNNKQFNVHALIMQIITEKMPKDSCDPSKYSHLKGLKLADPHFHIPGHIDILLGSDIFWNLLISGIRRGRNANDPVAVNSHLGWLVGGKLENKETKQVVVNYADCDLDKLLQQFWETEAIPLERTQTKEERDCEEHFKSNYKQNDDGRFLVKIPFKAPMPTLGTSRDISTRRFKQLEKRLQQQPAFYEEYKKFMRDYLSMGHMSLVPQSEVKSPLNPVCYIPHHFVQKESSTTTKFRVVFDASAKTTTNISLNNCMMVGPTLHNNLMEILMRFRKHRIVFTADIAKMYRQILVTPEDADLQRILWRESPAETLQEFRLTTVTYGTASAPYLATKCLQQLAHNNEKLLPVGAQIALNDFYVDDVMSGADSLESALAAKCQLLELMKKGSFPLRKFTSNSQAFLDSLPHELKETQTLMEINVDQTVKTLGVFWNPTTDEFLFKINLDNLNSKPNAKCGGGGGYTKRILLSEMSKIFDPLGWLAPVIITAKILIQNLWKLDLGWDVLLPEVIQQQWLDFKADLVSLEKIKIPRWMKIHSTTNKSDLIGFCDASEKAYAAVIYLFTEYQGGHIISLVASKTRVAPADQISLPRLELRGALLLSQLMTSVKNSLQIPIRKISAWTDSTVVLAWIKAHPSRWKTYVANRVTEIQSNIPPELWGHVSGIDNPADCASRGIFPSELADHPLWWNGPSWLKNGNVPVLSPLSPVISDEAKKEERKEVLCAKATVIHISSIYDYSSLLTLKRVVSWRFRFLHNCRAKLSMKKSPENPILPRSGPLSPEELQEALIRLVAAVQKEEFSKEINCLQNGQQLPLKSSLLPLNPFLDSSGILRVGGRLRHAPIPIDQKTPILLPRHHRLTELLISSYHQNNFHAGPQLVLSLINQQFWIINARDAIRHQLRKCVRCTRLRADTQQQFMGDFPAARVTPARPFLKCGVDYAGPFLLKSDNPRSKITYKSYLCLFVCFTTHALHLEVVSSLSTEAFLAALKRFISRRGAPSDIYSDCGTNFVGAAKELKEMIALVKSQQHNIQVADKLSNHGIHWHFNPPGAPHFGGLWEAGVKSVKFHLKRVIGLTKLTFEELSTTMTQIEACLNSRPLTPMSTDPNDFSALTPGHFLIGGPLNAHPEPNLLELKTGRLSRWQLVQQMFQGFWKRWSNEFIARLQQRPKWLKHRENIKVEDLVLIKDDNLSPLQWKLGRVIKVVPGSDGLVRTVTLKTSMGECDRPIVKLCLLPVDSSVEIQENPQNEDITASAPV